MKILKILPNVGLFHLRQKFNTNVLDLLKKKIFFPYDYWNSFEKFKEGLPYRDKLHNTLTNNEISDKNYKHVLNVWKASKMNTWKDFHYLYVQVCMKLLEKNP